MSLDDFLVIFRDTDILYSPKAYFLLTDSTMGTNEVGAKSLVDENISIKNREKIENLNNMTNYIISVISGTQRYAH